jgi:hypothetical protein
MRYLALTLLPLLVVACTDQNPVAPDTAPLFSVGGPHKQPISGVWHPGGFDDAAYVHETPSGICHIWDLPVYGYFDGDVEGDVVVHEDQNATVCDWSTGHLIGRGPFEANVTLFPPDGPSGTISGMWTTNCKRVAEGGLSCDGTMNGRGSEGLEGFHFHFKWGPGWWPFDYSGTVHY